MEEIVERARNQRAVPLLMKRARLATRARRALSLPGRALGKELVAAVPPVLATITLVAAALGAALLGARDLANDNGCERSESSGHLGISFPVSGPSATLAVCLIVCQPPAVLPSPIQVIRDG